MGACKECHGTGYTYYSAPGYGTSKTLDVCPLCLEGGVCPRCGRTLPESEPCACGWTEAIGRAEAEAIPRDEWWPPEYPDPNDPNLIDDEPTDYHAKRRAWERQQSGVTGGRAVATMGKRFAYPWGVMTRFEACERWHKQGERPWREADRYAEGMNVWVVSTGERTWLPVTLTEARYLAYLWGETLAA